jgi:hypothetical protein
LYDIHRQFKAIKFWPIEKFGWTKHRIREIVRFAILSSRWHVDCYINNENLRREGVQPGGSGMKEINPWLIRRSLMRIKHYVRANIDLKAVSIALLIYFILGLLFWGIESHIFWMEVTRVRLSTGANSSFDIANNMVMNKQIHFIAFLFRIFTYGIPSYVAGRKANLTSPRSALPFAIFIVFISVLIRIIFNPRTCYDYPVLFLFETAFSFGISIAAGVIGIRRREHFICRES